MDSTFIGPQVSECIIDISFSRVVDSLNVFTWILHFAHFTFFAVYFACRLGRKFYSRYYIIIFHILEVANIQMSLVPFDSNLYRAFYF